MGTKHNSTTEIPKTSENRRNRLIEILNDPINRRKLLGSEPMMVYELSNAPYIYVSGDNGTTRNEVMVETLPWPNNFGLYHRREIIGPDTTYYVGTFDHNDNVVDGMDFSTKIQIPKPWLDLKGILIE